MLPRRPSRLPQQAPHRVPQQADVRRVVHVGLDHERVTPAAQWLARLFFSDLVPTLHYQLPHRRQQLGGQQGHVVHHSLVLVTRPVAEITVPQERAYRLVMVRQVVQTVEVTAQALLENAQHQDLPQLHPRTPDRAVGLRHDMLVQQRKQTSAQLLVGPDVLKPLQHRRDVVPRLRVDPDLLDGHLSDLELPPVDFSHGVAVAKIPRKRPESTISTARIRHPGRSSPLTIRDTSRRIKQLRIFWPTLTRSPTRLGAHHCHRPPFRAPTRLLPSLPGREGGPGRRETGAAGAVRFGRPATEINRRAAVDLAR